MYYLQKMQQLTEKLLVHYPLWKKGKEEFDFVDTARMAQQHPASATQ